MAQLDKYRSQKQILFPCILKETSDFLHKSSYESTLRAESKWIDKFLKLLIIRIVRSSWKFLRCVLVTLLSWKVEHFLVHVLQVFCLKHLVPIFLLFIFRVFWEVLQSYSFTPVSVFKNFLVEFVEVVFHKLELIFLQEESIV